MSETNFPSNSKKIETDKGDRQRVQKVIRGETVSRKKPLGRKIAETFKGDDAQSVGQYILFEVIVPAAKNMLFDSITQGAERSLFGEVRRARGVIGSSRGSSYTSYGRVSAGGRAFEPDGPRRREPTKRAMDTHAFEEIIFEERGDAEVVLDALTDLIDTYQVSCVADMKDAMGQTPEHTDQKWGWTDLRGARIERVREGYLLNLPRTIPID